MDTIQVNLTAIGEVLEVRGPEGEPPYVVRWEEDGHEALFFPGSDASVQHFDHPVE